MRELVTYILFLNIPHKLKSQTGGHSALIIIIIIIIIINIISLKTLRKRRRELFSGRPVPLCCRKGKAYLVNGQENEIIVTV